MVDTKIKNQLQFLDPSDASAFNLGNQIIQLITPINIKDLENALHLSLLEINKQENPEIRFLFILKTMKKVTDDSPYPEKTIFCKSLENSLMKSLNSLKKITFTDSINIKISKLLSRHLTNKSLILLKKALNAKIIENEQNFVDKTGLNIADLHDFAKVLIVQNELKDILKNHQEQLINGEEISQTKKELLAKNEREIEKEIAKNYDEKIKTQKDLMMSTHHLFLRCLYDLKKVDEKIIYVDKILNE